MDLEMEPPQSKYDYDGPKNETKIWSRFRSRFSINLACFFLIFWGDFYFFCVPFAARGQGLAKSACRPRERLSKAASIIYPLSLPAHWVRDMTEWSNFSNGRKALRLLLYRRTCNVDTNLQGALTRDETKIWSRNMDCASD